MKSIKSHIYLFLILVTTLIPLNASAQLFGSDEENWNKVFRELKKINSRLVTLETSEMANFRLQLEDVLRQIEEIKQTMPHLQGAIELNKSETLANINKTNLKLSDLEAEVKNQVLLKINQQNKILELFKEDQNRFKEGLAQDIEKFAKVNKENFQNFASANNTTLEKVVRGLEAQDTTTKKGFEDTIGLFKSDVIPTMERENQDNRNAVLEHLSKSNEVNHKALESLTIKNQKLIEILGESLMQGAETKTQVDSISNNLAASNKNIAVTNKNLMVANEKINTLAETLKALQVQHAASGKSLDALKNVLSKVQELDQLADEKINKLIETSAVLTAHANKLEASVISELKQSSQKENSNQDKIDLANEKLSRLIEILKTIASEQDKLNQVIKVQTDLNKVQAGLQKNQENIKEALADLKRKANVSISRSDDIKKALGAIKKSNSGATPRP
mgnify:CR=1 FL=1